MVDKITFFKYFKIISISLLTIVFISSISLNIYFFNVKSNASSTTDIVDGYIDDVIDNITEEHDTIVENTEENIKDVQEKFDDNEYFVKVDDIEDLSTDEKIHIKINGVDYISDINIPRNELQEVNKFLAEQINLISSNYEEDIRIRDELIEDLKNDLEIMNENIKNDIIDHEINESSDLLKQELFKFGIDLYYNGSVTVNTLPSHGFGVGVNLLIGNTFNVRANVGLQQDILAQPIPYELNYGIGIGLYF